MISKGKFDWCEWQPLRSKFIVDFRSSEFPKREDNHPRVYLFATLTRAIDKSLVSRRASQCGVFVPLRVKSLSHNKYEDLVKKLL